MGCSLVGPGQKLSKTPCGYYADVVRTSIHYNPGLKNSQMLKITIESQVSSSSLGVEESIANTTQSQFMEDSRM